MVNVCVDVPIKIVLSSRSVSVSYTHLDVYKRQVCVCVRSRAPCRVAKKGQTDCGEVAVDSHVTGEASEIQGARDGV